MQIHYTDNREDYTPGCQLHYTINPQDLDTGATRGKASLTSISRTKFSNQTVWFCFYLPIDLQCIK